MCLHEFGQTRIAGNVEFDKPKLAKTKKERGDACKPVHEAGCSVQAKILTEQSYNRAVYFKSDDEAESKKKGHYEPFSSASHHCKWNDDEYKRQCAGKSDVRNAAYKREQIRRYRGRACRQIYESKHHDNEQESCR